MTEKEELRQQIDTLDQELVTLLNRRLTLIVCGDEDEPTLNPALYLKRAIPTAGLVMLPRTGHTMNLEEPAAFNRAVLDSVTLVEAGRWSVRDPATRIGAIIGE